MNDDDYDIDGDDEYDDDDDGHDVVDLNTKSDGLLVTFDTAGAKVKDC